jgi:hypothetical protein
MSIPCFEYAATVFRGGADGPRLNVQNGAGLFAAPGFVLARWFEEGRGNSANLFGLGIGDLVVFAITKGHVAVATGSGDQLIQSWYRVRDIVEAMRLRQLLERQKRGDFLKIPTRATAFQQLKPLDLATQSLIADKEELDSWADGPSSSRLQYVRYVFELHGVAPKIFHLKPEARKWLDQPGPLGPYLRTAAATGGAPV